MQSQNLKIRTSPFKAVVYEVWDTTGNRILFVTISRVDAEQYILMHQKETAG